MLSIGLYHLGSCILYFEGMALKRVQRQLSGNRSPGMMLLLLVVLMPLANCSGFSFLKKS